MVDKRHITFDTSPRLKAHARPPSEPATSGEPISPDEYDYIGFWRTRDLPDSHIPPSDRASQRPEHLRQTEALYRSLIQHQIVPKSIFEAGCGHGRLARFFATAYPEAAYEAIDLNPQCVKATLDIVPDATVTVGDIVTYDTDSRYVDLDFFGFDLVVASEVLMHIPPDNLTDAFDHLVDLCNPDNGRIVTIDWVPQEGELARMRRRGKSVAPWNFHHAYERLFRSRTTILSARRTDRQVVYVLKP